MDTSWTIPEDIQNAMVELAARFRIETGANQDTIIELMVNTIRIYSEYMSRLENESIN